MALPVILIDAATGSDTQASGAGPATALFGTTDASFSGATVTLTAGTDLTNVATDGSHVLYLLTSTGVRFFKITAKAGSGGATPTVDVTPNPDGTSTGRTWAIGGKLASIGSASSRLLVENGGSTGDAQAGWILELQSSETLSAAYNIRVTGSTAAGPFIFRGSGNPVVTFSHNGDAIVTRNSRIVLQDFELQNSNATKTASRAVVQTATLLTIRGVKISHATNKFFVGIDYRSSALLVRDCDIGYCAGNGIEAGTANTFSKLRFVSNHVHHCTANGMAISGEPTSLVVKGNIVTRNGADGVNMPSASGDASRHWFFIENTFDANTGDGLEIANDVQTPIDIINNIFSNNGGYGLKFSNGSATATYIDGSLITVDGNNTYNNTSGAYLPTGYGSNDPGLNPAFTNASGGDFSIGTNLKAKGYPLGGTLPIGTYSSTYSYVDPGAAQRQESGGGGSSGARLVGPSALVTPGGIV